MKKISLLLLPLLLLLNIPAALALEEDELLDPEVAFALSVEADDASTLTARWQIAEGYYLYRNKFTFQSNTPGAALGEVELPPGKVKQDEFFGEMEIYRGSVTARLPISWLGAPPETINITISSQGCADIGVCYPPQRTTLEVALPAESTSLSTSLSTPLSTPASSPLQQLGSFGSSLGLGGSSSDEILPPEKAFPFDAVVFDGNTIIARWDITPGHYLYKDKFLFTLMEADGITLGDPRLPAGEVKDDEFFGRIEVYHNPIEVTLPLLRERLEATEVTLQVQYQGCAEIGICYPPQKQLLTLKLPAGQVVGEARGFAPPIAAGQSDSLSWSELDLQNSDQVLAYLLNSPLTVVIAVSILLGLLIAFTACMYPMIPIVSSIIVGQGEKMTRGRGFFLTLVYVEAMALTFGLLGGIMGGIGGGVGLQAYFQSPWLLIPFAGLFVILALSMFGFYEIQVPSALQSRLATFSNRQRGGSLAGVGIMGSLSALIIGPCGGPILIAMLAYAAGIASIGKGFLALFAFGNGMGIPLLAVGLLGGELLPRAGTWMDTVKATAGVILLAVALVFLERMPAIFPSALTTFMWAALFIVSAIYMGALEPFKEGGSGWGKLRKGVAVIILLYGTLFLVASLTGGSGDLSDPLHGSSLTTASSARSSGGTAGKSVQFAPVKTVDDLQSELGKGQPVMLDFYADWCTYCKTYEKYVFTDPAVTALLAKFKTLKADVTDNDEADLALLKHAGVFLPPAILFYDANGNELRPLRVVGEMNPTQFRRHLEKVLAAM